MSCNSQQLMDPLGPARDEPAILAERTPEPPAELLAEMARADERYAALAAEGKHVAFSLDPRDGRLSIELQSATGSRELSPDEALDLACDTCTKDED